MALESKLTEKQLFDQLVSSLVHSAWVYLGTLKNPMNDELEKDLEQASIQIDMLDMIYKRMTGNLSQDEEKFFSENIHALKMNYVEQKNDPNEKNGIKSTNNQKGKQS
jgi:hypothetical protein